MIPQINDFYDENLPTAPPWHNNYRHSAAFISHLHLDHSKMLNFVIPKIPIYNTPQTIKLLTTLNEKGEFLLPAANHPATYLCLINELSPYQKIKVGNLSVEFYPVDHDANEAVAIFIHTPDKFIVYTGDLRLHGFPECTRTMMTAAYHCDLLISEGSRSEF